ncbi:MAG TPA: nicotinate-nucleotide--dimethylbenzimidazole phosphoribosyltransferase [Planctomycetota bacterium]|nr:nicotinate-nucleotide--dimethylbenzimidazole phosphoribosyltransferase [Planctomycetota bacterium]
MNLLDETVSGIGRLDNAVMDKVQKRLDNLTKPQGSLGRLEELAKHIAGITGQESPTLKHKIIFTLVGDHGVTEEGVSAYPKKVTPQMVYNFLRGGAGINVLAKQMGARVVIVDMGVCEKLQVSGYKLQDNKTVFKDCKINLGTSNFTKGPAMSREEAIKSIEAGIKLVEEEISNGLNIVGTGDMGIGNTTPSSAITAVFTDCKVEDVTGYGTGINESGWAKKVESINKGIVLNKPDSSDPVDVLAKVGGYEIGGIAGVILGAARHRIPVVIDGFISGAGALIAVGLAPQAKDFIIASHCSQERGHKYALAHMDLKPLLDLNLRLGEGTGAALAMSLCESAVRILNEMATFGEASVSEKKKEE